MTDERLLTAAKLYEQARESGDLDGDPSLLDHAGLPTDDRHGRNLTFLSGAEIGWHGSRLADLVDAELRTRAATDAVRDGDPESLAYLVGVTEQELDASSLTLPLRLIDRLDATELTCITAAGNPNSGKTNTMLLLAELLRAHLDDLLVITNVATWDQSDVTVQTMHGLLTELVDHREIPKFVVVDEGSTHFDARTRSHQVSSQWTPTVKRMSKLGVECCGVIGHTGKDIHPEQKRLTSLALWKQAPDEATFYDEWPEEESRPEGELFGGRLEHLEPVPPESYDPDDMSPWSWNLDPDVFNRPFKSWDEFAALVADAKDS